MAEGVGFGRWAAGVSQANFQHHVVFPPESKQSCHLQSGNDHERHFMDVTKYGVSFEAVLLVCLLSPLNFETVTTWTTADTFREIMF